MTSFKEEYMRLDGANKFLLAHCQETLATIRKHYHGVSHSVNRCNAEYADCWKAVEGLRERCDKLETEVEQANAAIGELRESLQKARKAYAELKNGRQNEAKVP